MTVLSPGNRSTRLPIHPSQAAESVYRPFFLAGIVAILTAGAAWGAWLLWEIGRTGSFTEISIHAVNAHGHAQIFGWVGLFIMGFAYQAFPRMWNTTLSAAHLAPAAFALMLIGLTLLTVGQAMAETWRLAFEAVIAGGIMQTVAVTFFAAQIAATFVRSSEPLSPAVGFIMLALLWFVLMTVMNLWHTAMLLTAETRDALLHQIATYQAALRHMQIHGLGLFMILGVSMRFFPGMFGIRKTPALMGWIALAFMSIAVSAEIVLLIAARVTESTALAGLLIVPWLMLAVGVAIIVLPWRLWRPLPQVHRSTKFIRAAYLWLGISLLMLLLLPAYTALHGMDFSHAYYGALRHAITVGFISMMILGVAAKVVPLLRGIDHRELSALWGPFILVNAGCALRVSMQVVSDWHGMGYALIGFSGVLEVAGLAWWGVALAWLMVRPRELPSRALLHPKHRVSLHEAAAGEAADIDPELTMREMSEKYPHLQSAMTKLGLDTCCGAERTLREMAAQRGLHPVQLAAALVDSANAETIQSHAGDRDAQKRMNRDACSCHGGS